MRVLALAFAAKAIVKSQLGLAAGARALGHLALSSALVASAYAVEAAAAGIAQDPEVCERMKKVEVAIDAQVAADNLGLSMRSVSGLISADDKVMRDAAVHQYGLGKAFGDLSPSEARRRQRGGRRKRESPCASTTTATSSTSEKLAENVELFDLFEGDSSECGVQETDARSLTTPSDVGTIADVHAARTVGGKWCDMMPSESESDDDWVEAVSNREYDMARKWSCVFGCTNGVHRQSEDLSFAWLPKPMLASGSDPPPHDDKLVQACLSEAEMTTFVNEFDLLMKARGDPANKKQIRRLIVSTAQRFGITTKELMDCIKAAYT